MEPEQPLDTIAQVLGATEVCCHVSFARSSLRQRQPHLLCLALIPRSWRALISPTISLQRAFVDAFVQTKGDAAKKRAELLSSQARRLFYLCVFALSTRVSLSPMLLLPSL